MSRSRREPDPERPPCEDDGVPPALERLRCELAETLDRLEDAVEELAGRDAGEDDEEPRRNR